MATCYQTRTIRHLLGVVLLAASPVQVSAQDTYPARAVRIIVPLSASAGTASVLPRMVAEKLSERWGRPMLIDHRPGAAGIVGAELVARAEPDGHTLLASPPPALVINQNLYKLSFDPASFVPVTVIATVPFVLVAHPAAPVSNVQQLIAFAKANPNRLTYASAGGGSIPHVTMEWLKMRGDASILHVPYKGIAPAKQDLLSGQVHLLFDNLGNALQHIASGRLKAIAVASEKRVSPLPDVQAISEVYPGFVSDTWFAIVAPPKTPPEIAARLSATIRETLRMPDVVSRLHDFSARPLAKSPSETDKFLKQEAVRWREVIRTAHIKAD